MKLLRHYLKVYGLILSTGPACGTWAVLWAYTKLIGQAHWVAKFGGGTKETNTLVLFGKRVYFPSYVFLLHQFEEIFVLDAYRSEILGKKTLIIDGGSHLGMSVLYFITAYPESKVLSFEPDAKAFQLLQQFVRHNHLSQVTLVNAALAGTTGKLTFFTHADASGKLDAGAYTTSTATVPVTVPAQTLSTYLTEPVALLKLDIEGAEVEVIQELIASQKIAMVQEIVLEFHTEIHPSPENLVTLLANAGFTAKRKDALALYETDASDFLLHFTRK
ncbi:FkbM family methyltransferase [Nibribacter koreensis]|uniref:Methyltransferase FkbM domain-containing protein n=1 Tax=Nibribacter koreensis TaxID=1084519 RepID=A0ABP8FK07_9BACT